MKLRGRKADYVIGALLGAGGMATVHRGRSLKAPYASVAIKRILPHLAAADPTMVKRFEREARLTETLEHPNIARVVDVITSDEGPALVLELVDGGSLQALMYTSWNRGDPVPPGVAAAVLLDVLAGLGCAHEHTEGGAPSPILHRDVSPHNVLVGRDGVARLADFGIARLGDVGSTDTGQLKGKLGYMAPELFGKAKPSVRSDVYGVGVMAWELLASERLFEGELAGVLGQILSTDRARADLSSRGVAAEVAAVVRRALDPDPDRRFESASVFADALRSALPPASRAEVAAWVEGAALSLPGEAEIAPPSSAAQTTVLDRDAAPQPRRRARVGLAVTAVAVVAAGAWAAASLRSEPAPAAPAASAPLSAAPDDAAPPPSSAPAPSAAPSDAVAPSPVEGSASATPSASAPRTPKRRTLDKALAEREARAVYDSTRQACVRSNPTAVLGGLYTVTFNPSGAVQVPPPANRAEPCMMSGLASIRGQGAFDGEPYSVIVGGVGRERSRPP